MFTVCEVPNDILNGTRHATITTELADGRTVEDKWQYKCNDGYLILHSQDAVVECNSNSEITPKDLPQCVRREFTVSNISYYNIWSIEKLNGTKYDILTRLHILLINGLYTLQKLVINYIS